MSQDSFGINAKIKETANFINSHRFQLGYDGRAGFGGSNQRLAIDIIVERPVQQILNVFFLNRSPVELTLETLLTVIKVGTQVITHGLARNTPSGIEVGTDKCVQENRYIRLARVVAVFGKSLAIEPDFFRQFSQGCIHGVTEHAHAQLASFYKGFLVDASEPRWKPGLLRH